MFQPLMIPQGTESKRFDTDFYVEGFATTFDKPYVMYEYGGIKYCEVIDRNALVGADLSDVIMQFDHSGMVFARNKMAKNKPPSLLLEPQDGGLFIAANLSLTEEAKRLYASIDAGLICKMSWAFTVSEDAYNKDTHTRTILKIKKVYDVSAVSYPANGDTDISARSYFDGVIEREQQERLERRKQILKIKLMVRGIWQGFQNMSGWLESRVRAMMREIVAAVEDEMQIASPSKVFAGIGAYMAQGLGEGFGREMRGVEKSIRKATDNAVPDNDDPRPRKGGRPETRFEVVQNIYANETSYAQQQREAARQFRMIAREVMT